MAIWDVRSTNRDGLQTLEGGRTMVERSRPVERPRGGLAVLWHRKLLILACVAICGGAGAVYIVAAKPLYLAGSAVLIDPQLGKAVGTDPTVPGFIADTAAIDSQVKLLTSQPVLRRVAAMADLATDPQFNGSQRSALSRLLHPRETGAGDPVDLGALERAITIKRPERTYVVNIEVLAQSPDKAAEIANDIPKAYIADQVQARVGAAKGDTTYVQQTLARLSKEILATDEKIEAYKARHDIVDSSGQRINEQQLGDLTKALSEARARSTDAQAKRGMIDQLARSGHLDASSDALHSATVERLRQQQADADGTVARLEKTLGPRHPELVEARARKAEVGAAIRDELRRQRIAAAADSRSAEQSARQILAAVGKLKGQSIAMSRALVPLEQLTRSKQALQASFDRFSQIGNNLAQQEGTTPPARLLSVAEPPVSPAKPAKTTVLGISLATGGFLGVILALALEPAQPDPPRLPPAGGPPSPDPYEVVPPSRGRPRRYWDDEEDFRT